MVGGTIMANGKFRAKQQAGKPGRKPQAIRLSPSDVELAEQIREKWNLPGIPVVDVIRVMLRRVAEKEGVKVA